MISLESGYNNNCVNRAISTMRVLLGYDGKTQIEETENKNALWAVKQVVENFPNHKVMVWCQEKYFYQSNNSVCMGLNFNLIDDRNKVISFCYLSDSTRGDSGIWHMVIGLPHSNFEIGIIFAIGDLE